MKVTKVQLTALRRGDVITFKDAWGEEVIAIFWANREGTVHLGGQHGEKQFTERAVELQQVGVSRIEDARLIAVCNYETAALSIEGQCESCGKTGAVWSYRDLENVARIDCDACVEEIYYAL